MYGNKYKNVNILKKGKFLDSFKKKSFIIMNIACYFKFHNSSQFCADKPVQNNRLNLI